MKAISATRPRLCPYFLPPLTPSDNRRGALSIVSRRRQRCDGGNRRDWFPGGRGPRAAPGRSHFPSCFSSGFRILRKGENSDRRAG